MDKAIAPTSMDDDDLFELLTHDETARAAVRRYREVQRIAQVASGR